MRNKRNKIERERKRERNIILNIFIKSIWNKLYTYITT